MAYSATDLGAIRFLLGDWIFVAHYLDELFPSSLAISKPYTY